MTATIKLTYDRLKGHLVVVPIDVPQGVRILVLDCDHNEIADLTHEVCMDTPEDTKQQPKRVLNDWTPETLSLLNALTAAGFTLVSGDNGEDKFKYNGDLKAFIANLIACDESHLYVQTPTGKAVWLYLVLGNDTGELVADYRACPELDAITEAHALAWEGKPQPTIEG